MSTSPINKPPDNGPEPAQADKVASDATGNAPRLISWMITGGALTAAVIAGLTLTAQLKSRHDGFSAVSEAVGITSALTVFALYALILTATGGKYGLFRSIIGTDNRYSTSRLSPAIWTAFVAFTLPYLLMSKLAREGAGASFEAIFPNSWDQYTVLLGGPFAAMALAKGITIWKLQGGQLQKPTAADPHLKDLATDDNGQNDLVDSQYLLFNLIAFIYVAAAFWSKRVWPEIPPTLLGLTSVSAALYVGNKSATRNPPTITSVVPLSARGGNQVTISGRNFKPAGSEREPAILIAGDANEIPVPDAADSSITFTMPIGAPVGNTTLQVISSDRVATAPQDFTILTTVPIITGTVGGALIIPGQQVALAGENLAPPDGGSLALTINDITVPADPQSDGKRVEVDVPSTITIGDDRSVSVKVTINGVPSQAVKLPASMT